MENCGSSCRLTGVALPHQEEAEELGMEMRRAPSLNLSPTFTRSAATPLSLQLQ